MVNLTTNINVVNAIPNIRKWKVDDAAEGAPIPGYFVGTLVAARLKGL